MFASKLFSFIFWDFSPKFRKMLHSCQIFFVADQHNYHILVGCIFIGFLEPFDNILEWTPACYIVD